MFARFRAKRPGAPLIHLLIYEICSLASALFMILCFRARAYHPQRVPMGPVLLVANHQSYLDPPLVGAFIGRRQISYVARSGLFRFKPLGWLITALNSIPLRENSGDAAAIREVIRRLGSGDAVLIFPEGARTPDGHLHEFKRGTALLVKRAKCPVVPVAIAGAFDAWPRIRSVPRLFRRRIGVIYGHAISYNDLMKDGPEAGLKRLEHEVTALLAELHGRMRGR